MIWTMPMNESRKFDHEEIANLGEGGRESEKETNKEKQKEEQRVPFFLAVTTETKENCEGRAVFGHLHLSKFSFNLQQTAIFLQKKQHPVNCCALFPSSSLSPPLV